RAVAGIRAGGKTRRTDKTRAVGRERSARRAMPAHRGLACSFCHGVAAPDLSRRFRRASAVARKMGAALCRWRRLAGCALLGRRRLRLQAQDELEWRTADLCRSALCRTG